MAVFLLLSALYVIGWGLMFDSTTFRWTYFQWSYFGAIVTLSAILAIMDLIVGIMCRLNFDKGLPNHCERITMPSLFLC
jgi:Na+/alanine symporter